MQASGETGVPMAFGVLTTDTWEQAEARAGDGRDNKGFEAAAAALEMAELFGTLRGGGTGDEARPKRRRGGAPARPRCRCSINGRSGAAVRATRS